MQDNAAYFPVTHRRPAAAGHQVDLDFTIDPHGGNRAPAWSWRCWTRTPGAHSGIAGGPVHQCGPGQLAGDRAGREQRLRRRRLQQPHRHPHRRRAGQPAVRHPDSVDLGSGTPIHATITVAQTDGGALVSVVLTPQGGSGVHRGEQPVRRGLRRCAPPRRDRRSQPLRHRGPDRWTMSPSIAVAGAGPGAADHAWGRPSPGRSPMPARSSSYSFDLAAPARLVFDNLTADSNYLDLFHHRPGRHRRQRRPVQLGQLQRRWQQPPDPAGRPLRRQRGQAIGSTGAFSLPPAGQCGRHAAQPSARSPTRRRVVTLDPGNSTTAVQLRRHAGQVVTFENFGARPTSTSGSSIQTATWSPGPPTSATSAR